MANNPLLRLLMTRVVHSRACLFGFFLTLLFVLFVSLSLDYHCLSMHSCLKTSTPGGNLLPRWTLVYNKKAFLYDAYCPLFTVWGSLSRGFSLTETPWTWTETPWTETSRTETSQKEHGTTDRDPPQEEH